jgi:glyoxylase-like metal-dependent hydrolase (beta-lactamase superfamily II)
MMQPMSEWYSVRKVAPGVHLLCGALGQENSYLVEGEEYAALIDTGRGLGNIRLPVETLTAKPIVVLNTHGHWDHIGGNFLFEQIGVHALEADALRRPAVPASVSQHLLGLREQGKPLPAEIDPAHFSVQPSEPTFHLEQGQEIDLGGRRLAVWHTPGHSPGSVCFVDEADRLLFAGDTIMEGSLAFYMSGSAPQEMLQSFETLGQMAWELDLVLPGHGAAPTDGRLILELADGLRRTLAGDVPLKKGISARGAARIATFERFAFFFPPDWQPPAAGAKAHGDNERGDPHASG